jgi:tetratricopeptide (TPR) repeat protein
MTLAATALLVSAALADLLRQHQAQPGNAEICERIGVAYLQEQQLQPAAEFFRKALALKPDLIPARKNLGTALWFLNEHDASAREFRYVLKAAPRDPVANLYTGLHAYERKDFIAASDHLEVAGELAAGNPEVRPIWLESLLGAAEQRDHAGRPDSAYETYRKALLFFPDSEESYLAVARFAAAHANNDYARNVVDAGLDRLPGSARLRFERGILLALDGKLEQAAAEFLKAQNTDPAWAPATLALGVARLQQSKFAEAAAGFDRAAKLAPGDWRPEYLYALALHKSGDPTLVRPAIKSLEHAIQMAPSEPKAYTLLGQIQSGQGRGEEALSLLEKAYRMSPNDSTTLYQLGLLYRKQGRAADAARVMQAFQAAKAKSRSEEAELIQILRVPSR